MKDFFGNEIKEGDVVAVAVVGGWQKGLNGPRIVLKMEDAPTKKTSYHQPSRPRVLLNDPTRKHSTWFSPKVVVKYPERHPHSEFYKSTT